MAWGAAERLSFADSSCQNYQLDQLTPHAARRGITRAERKAVSSTQLVALQSRSPGLHELLLPARGNGIVMTQLHGVSALTAGESFET